jgi:crotonobetainyl-CoA:carnitine CoA-transferase CaiB-like acyl-CoA transferase
METLESNTPPTPFPPSQPSSGSSKPQILTGIKVLDLSRVIAGPVVSRTLAQYGACVLKITSPNLPDVPYYQVDLNFGKRTAELDLRDEGDRAKFEKLLEAVDVVVDGYRAGALEGLGYGPKGLTERFQRMGRKKVFVYVGEICLGWKGPWRERSGWQHVADAVCSSISLLLSTQNNTDGKG